MAPLQLKESWDSRVQEDFNTPHLFIRLNKCIIWIFKMHKNIIYNTKRIVDNYANWNEANESIIELAHSKHSFRSEACDCHYESLNQLVNSGTPSLKI